MNLYSECIGAIRSMRSGRPIDFDATPVPQPSSDAYRIERFAIQSHVLSVIAPQIFRVDENGDARFLATPDEVVTTPATLAVWTSELFKEAVSERCKTGDKEMQGIVDRLDALNEPMYELSLKMAGLNTPEYAMPVSRDKIERAMSSMQTENFALELDKSMRLLELFARIYGLEFPDSATNKRGAMLGSFSNHFALAKQSIEVQDFFDALGVFSLLTNNQGEGDAPQRYKTSVELTNIYWDRLHGMKAKDHKPVPGEKPKAFYKIATSDGVIQSAEPIVEKVAKRLDKDTVEQRIGCAAILQKAAGLPKSVLHIGLEATVHAFSEIGYFDRSAKDFTGYDMDLLRLIERNGKSYFLGQSALSCIGVLKGSLS